MRIYVLQNLRREFFVLIFLNFILIPKCSLTKLKPNKNEDKFILVRQNEKSITFHIPTHSIYRDFNVQKKSVLKLMYILNLRTINDISHNVDFLINIFQNIFLSYDEFLETEDDTIECIYFLKIYEESIENFRAFTFTMIPLYKIMVSYRKICKLNLCKHKKIHNLKMKQDKLGSFTNNKDKEISYSFYFVEYLIRKLELRIIISLFTGNTNQNFLNFLDHNFLMEIKKTRTKTKNYWSFVEFHSCLKDLRGLYVQSKINTQDKQHYNCKFVSTCQAQITQNRDGFSLNFENFHEFQRNLKDIIDKLMLKYQNKPLNILDYKRILEKYNLIAVDDLDELFEKHSSAFDLNPIQKNRMNKYKLLMLIKEIKNFIEAFMDIVHLDDEVCPIREFYHMETAV